MLTNEGVVWLYKTYNFDCDTSHCTRSIVQQGKWFCILLRAIIGPIETLLAPLICAWVDTDVRISNVRCNEMFAGCGLLFRS
jgi:hypothetical protein